MKKKRQTSVTCANCNILILYFIYFAPSFNTFIMLISKCCTSQKLFDQITKWIYKSTFFLNYKLYLTKLQRRSVKRTQKRQIGPKNMTAVKLLLCLLSLTASNFCCVALVSFFMTTLPNKRNLFTFFDTLLVISSTILVDISVRIN